MTFIGRLATFAMLMVWGHQAGAAAHLVATLSQNVSAAAPGRVLITVVLENAGDKSVHVYTPMTPFIAPLGKLSNNLFEVVDAFGHGAAYTGSRTDFGPPPMELFKMMAPGDRFEQEVDITQAYDFQNGGPFTIRYTLHMAWHEPDPRVTSQEQASTFLSGLQDVVSSNVLQVFVSPYRPAAPSWMAASGRMCTSDEWNKAQGAWRKAVSQANQAEIFTQQLQPRTTHPRYRRWFGDSTLVHDEDDTETPRLGYQDRVVDLVDATYSRLALERFSPLCGCESHEATATVEDRTYYRIYLCDKFFRLLEDGPSPSMAGALIHEFSHFKGDEYGPGSDDYFYGIVRAEAAALSDPRTAIRNAENYELYITDRRPYSESSGGDGNKQSQPIGEKP